MLIIDGFSIHSLGPSPCWESELPLACQAALLRRQQRNVETKSYTGKENLGFAYRPPSQSGWLVSPINCGRSWFWTMQGVAFCYLIQILSQLFQCASRTKWLCQFVGKHKQGLWECNNNEIVFDWWLINDWWFVIVQTIQQDLEATFSVTLLLHVNYWISFFKWTWISNQVLNWGFKYEMKNNSSANCF